LQNYKFISKLISFVAFFGFFGAECSTEKLCGDFIDRYSYRIIACNQEFDCRLLSYPSAVKFERGRMLELPLKPYCI